tara:strand:- start:2464 stop:2622 length:159 start_codon:yes stop_codon:yes gene_type:complete
MNNPWTWEQRWTMAWMDLAASLIYVGSLGFYKPGWVMRYMQWMLHRKFSKED